MPPPRIWTMFAGYFGVAPPLSRTWWRALEQSKWTHSRSFRHSLVLFEGRAGPSPDAVVTFVETAVTPQTVIENLLHLEQEGRLTHTEANTLMEAVLTRVKYGQWI